MKNILLVYIFIAGLLAIQTVYAQTTIVEHSQAKGLTEIQTLLEKDEFTTFCLATFVNEILYRMSLVNGEREVILKLQKKVVPHLHEFNYDLTLLFSAIDADSERVLSQAEIICGDYLSYLQRKEE